MITVVNVKTFKGPYEYCGRASAYYSLPASPLANPFPMRNESDRERVLTSYDKWLVEKTNTGDKAVCAELKRLLHIAERGDLNLGCYCAPKACHCDAIKALLEKYII